MDIKGFTYGFDAKSGEMSSKRAARSQELLFETGVNWICLPVVCYQETAHSFNIEFDFERTASDRDLLGVIKRAHENGIKVCLKPMVNCRDGVWRAYINFADSDYAGRDIYWDKWFSSYGSFMKYYARLAGESGCEMLCLGCEMCGTERKEAHWRKLIEEIRAIYSGELVYNTNHGHEDDVKWFDAVDYVGTSAYFPVTSGKEAASEEMQRAWHCVGKGMQKLYERWQKKVVFMEIGCRSAKGCASMPWDFMHKELPRDEDEQAAFYDSCLAAFADKEWFSGAFWWDWNTFIYESREEAAADNGFGIHLKKAEDIVKKWYCGK